MRLTIFFALVILGSSPFAKADLEAVSAAEPEATATEAGDSGQFQVAELAPTDNSAREDKRIAAPKSNRCNIGGSFLVNGSKPQAIRQGLFDNDEPESVKKIMAGLKAKGYQIVDNGNAVSMQIDLRTTSRPYLVSYRFAPPQQKTFTVKVSLASADGSHMAAEASSQSQPIREPRYLPLIGGGTAALTEFQGKMTAPDVNGSIKKVLAQIPSCKQ